MCPGRHGSLSVCRATSFLFLGSTFSYTIPIPAVTTCLPGWALPFRRRRLAAVAGIDATFLRYALYESLRQADLTRRNKHFLVVIKPINSEIETTHSAMVVLKNRGQIAVPINPPCGLPRAANG